ncbi:hypothetical protein OJ998_02460 [Solirubrobacter taibaiensis]|nr:hypothetical protein [Solirubrobacter taibaiensis]
MRTTPAPAALKGQVESACPEHADASYRALVRSEHLGERLSQSTRGDESSGASLIAA